MVWTLLDISFVRFCLFTGVFSFASIMFLHARFGVQPGRFEELFPILLSSFEPKTRWSESRLICFG